MILSPSIWTDLWVLTLLMARVVAPLALTLWLAGYVRAWDVRRGA